MGKLEQMLIHSVHLEQQGWIVKFVQKCEHCDTSNAITKYSSMVKCGKCNEEYHMNDPKLQVNGGRQHGFAEET